MNRKIVPLNIDQVNWAPIRGKKHKVEKSSLARTWKEAGSLTAFLDSLPDILAAKDFREVVQRISRAVGSKRLVLLGMGAHPIKVGLSPVLIDWMEKGIMKGLAMNGAGAIHDLELAMAGHTSEEVEEELSRGTFGMVKETHEAIHAALHEGMKQGSGMGQALGRTILERKFKFNHLLSPGGRRGRQRSGSPGGCLARSRLHRRKAPYG